MFLTKTYTCKRLSTLENIFFLYIILHSSKRDGADSMKLSEKQTQSLRLDPTCMSVAMYVAYIPQIMNN